MRIESVMLLDSFCRTCMNDGLKDGINNEVKSHKAISIFNKLKSMECKSTIRELLILITPQLSIERGDLLPKIICESCLERLIMCYKFQEMCIRVERKLRQLIYQDDCVDSSTTSKDPLKVSLIDKAIENIAVSQTFNDCTNILKEEMDKSPIDQNEPAVSNKSVVRPKTPEYILEEMSASDKNGEVDSESEWETPSQNTNGKTVSKVAVKEKRVDELSNNKRVHSKNAVDVIKKDVQMSLFIDESEKNCKYRMIKDEENKKFVCDECGKRLKTAQILRRHKRIHKRNAIYNLKEEGKTSIIIDESKNNGKNSNNINDNESKKFVCDECGKRLKSRPVLRKHKQIHLRPAKNPLECGFCKQVFQQINCLREHLRTHTAEQPFLCSECGKGFNSMSSLKEHYLRHNNDKSYVCPDCPKRFPCLSNLSAHKNVHKKKNKSHVCDICGAGFIQAYLLKKHKIYHGERNHKCDYCEMRFFLPDHCRRHMRTHTGEKPYKCKYCERAYAQSNDLIKHLRSHLGDNVYKCDLCPQGFRMQTELRVHFSTHKNDDEETRARNLQALNDEKQRVQMKFGLDECTLK